MILAALSDVNGVTPNVQDRTGPDQAAPDQAVSNQAGVSAEVPAMDEASSQGFRALQEKLETAFTPAKAGSNELPPRIFQSGFDSAAQQQVAAFQNLHTRIDRLESDELTDLRETMREICEAISGLALEAERGANETDEKIKALAESIQTQLQADRERLDAIEARAAQIESANQSALAEVHAAMRALDERMRVGDSHNEDLAYNMRTLRGELAGLNETTEAVRRLEARMQAGDTQAENVSHHIALIQSELANLNQTAAAATHRLAERLRDADDRHDLLARNADIRHDALARNMNMLKGELLSEAAIAMRGHQTLLEQAETSIAELRERNARSAARIESLSDSLAHLDHKFDAHGSSSQQLAERLAAMERGYARTQERERLRAELHARLADTLDPRQD